MTRKAVYTCLTGNYDHLLQPEAVSNDYDYICFTDNPGDGNDGVWKLLPMPAPPGTSSKRASRYPKLLPHLVLPDYDYSLYIDANVQIIHPDFYKTVDRKIAAGIRIAQVPHTVPPVDCTYDEIAYAYYHDKVTLLQALRQAHHLKTKHFPRHFGLFENNLILRQHNHPRVAAISQQWWEEYCSRAPRDQFSLMYVYWKNHYMPDLLLPPGECTRNSPWLAYHPHSAEQQPQETIAKRLQRRMHRYTYPLLRKIV